MIDLFWIAIWLAVTILAGLGILRLIFYPAAQHRALTGADRRGGMSHQRKGEPAGAYSPGGLHKGPALFFWEALALSYCLGVGAISIEMAVLSLSGIKFSALTIVAWLTPIFLAAVFIRPGPKQTIYYSDAKDGTERFSLLEKFFVFVIFSQSAYAFFTALLKPMEAYDAVVIYAAKSKIFYLLKCIPPNFFKDFGNLAGHIEYPLLGPLAETCFYLFFGRLDDRMVKIIFPLYYIAILTVLYYILRRVLKRRHALLFTFLTATVPLVIEHAATGYMDLLLAFYYSASFFYLILWMRERKTGFLILSFLLGVLGVWTKAEGLMLMAVNLAIIGIFILRDGRAVFGKGIFYLAAALASAALYMYARQMAGLGMHGDFAAFTPSYAFSAMTNFKKVLSILYQFQRQLFVFKKWNIIYVFFLVFLILRFRAAFSKDLKFITLAVFFALSGYAMIFLFLPGDAAGHFKMTLSRFFIHFLPVVVLWIAYMFKEEGLDI